MTQTETIRDSLLDAAERRARTTGYNGFSFRDLAADVGIKSASVHYHFPTKPDLAYALLERYREDALRQLGVAGDAQTALERVADLFRRAALSGEMCLCGAIGAAIGAVPPEVQASAARFSEALAEWLMEAPDWREALPVPPLSIVAMLEGALLLSIAARDPALFDAAIDPVLGAQPRNGATSA